MTRDPKVVRAAFHDDAVVVYQAYSPLIADEALRLGTFGPAFSRSRMTWIKPSFGVRAALAAAVLRLWSTAKSPHGSG